MIQSMRECVLDLEKYGQLIRIPQEVDPELEMAEIHRRVFQAGGPALFYERVKGSPFPAVSNLFGTPDRGRLILRHTLENVKKLVRLKAEPAEFFKHPTDFFGAARAACNALPLKVSSGPALFGETKMGLLPQIKCWPKDGGAFILLPQVFTEHPDHPGILHSNLGMYRIQMSGNRYEPDRQIGLHYQIRRDIGIHHAAAIKKGQPLKVSVFVGGPPAHTFAAVMYLPEGLSELSFAGALAGRNFRYARKDGHVISTDADFVITGTVEPGVTLPEGPFGDHLGYYSLQHEFPVMRVEKVYHRQDAIWPFTVVGRPPQEDSTFGQLIQEIAAPMLPKEIPGVKSVHAVDASGVHPLMLAIGSERYTPYAECGPQEVLTQAHALLGYGPCSLAKYLWIAAGEDEPLLKVHDIAAFLRHVLQRVDWRRDLHFQTSTTMDTLDYSGTGLNRGSKVIIAAAGLKKRELASSVPDKLRLPEGLENPRVALPGVLVIQAPAFRSYAAAPAELSIYAKQLESQSLDGFPLMVITDDSDFTAKTLNNFLWVTFTRSNPAHDIYGVRSFNEFKHWGCEGSLIIDARLKPQHAPPLEEDPAVSRRVDALAAPGGPLHRIF